jgi:hypothetical protein
MQARMSAPGAAKLQKSTEHAERLKQISQWPLAVELHSHMQSAQLSVS